MASLKLGSPISGVMDKKYFMDMKILFPLLMFIWIEMGSARATQGESKKYPTRANVEQFALTELSLD